MLRGNERVIERVIERRRQTEERVATTWMVASELHYGAAKSSHPQENRAVVSSFLTTLDVLETGDAAARTFGQLKADLEGEGQRLADADLLIAAVALAHEAALVTGNTRHYDRIDGLDLEDWVRG